MGLRSVAGPVALDRLAYEAQSAQVVVVGPGIGGGHLGNGRDFWRGEPGLQRSRDPAGDLAFDAEDVVQGALVALGPEVRSEERRVGKEGVSTCRFRWSPYHSQKKYTREHE